MQEFYHYSLNFKEGIQLDDPKNSLDCDVGFIISSALGKDKLYSSLFLTNLNFGDPHSAHEYLALTYTPRFRYIIETNYASHINYRISLRTCPAFGKPGGAGEWLILRKDLKTDSEATNIINKFSIDGFYPNGGNVDRWYMGAWDRELLERILAVGLIALSGKKVSRKTFSEAIVSGWTNLENAEEGKMNNIFGEASNEEEDYNIIASPLGIVGYKRIDRKKVEKGKDIYLLNLYISISVGFSHTKDKKGIYIKFWGNMWTDIFKLPVTDTSESDENLCDSYFINHDRTDCLLPNSIMDMLIKPFNLYADNKICGVRLINKNIVEGDYYISDNDNKNHIESVVRLKATELLNLLKIYSYRLKDSCLYWGNVNYTSLLYLPSLIPKICW